MSILWFQFMQLHMICHAMPQRYFNVIVLCSFMVPVIVGCDRCCLRIFSVNIVERRSCVEGVQLTTRRNTPYSLPGCTLFCFAGHSDSCLKTHGYKIGELFMHVCDMFSSLVVRNYRTIVEHFGTVLNRT